jgi:DNA primase
MPGQGKASQRLAGRTVRCRQPWGFVDAAGQPVSWIGYVKGTTGSRDFGGALRELARRAGVEDSSLSSLWATENQSNVQQYERQRELMEAFVAYCHIKLCSDEGHVGLEYLQRTHGINGHEANDLPLGIYTSAQDVDEYLRGVGFTDAEIRASKVVRDVRLTGRVIIPWRDRWGNVRTIVAHDTSGQLNGRPRQLYRKCDATEDAFGLNWALRPGSGGLDHLILVESLMDVVYFHTHGLGNVATFGATGKIPTCRQWERLADHGIRHVTLALADDQAGWERTLAALGNSYQAERSPRVFALAQNSLDMARGAATCARLRGMPYFRHVVAQRLHGFHFVAQALIKEYKTGSEWTDAGLVDLLNDAIEFDASVYTARRALELERFFWPPILEALGATWEAVRQMLRRRLEQPEPVKVRTEAPARPVRQVTPPPPPPPVIHPPTVEFRRQEPKPVLQPQPPAADPEPLPVDLARLAYEIWEKKGRPANSDQQCWYEAVELVRQRQAKGERIYARSA